ncbi:MAG: hypothetical protein F2667_10525, partial [Actinobacteria bacterium]|nr:hypothetical protein [Actinomycetota bacterium]
MTRHRTGHVKRAAALVPLGLLSAAWTASLVTAGAGSTVAAPEPASSSTLGDGTSVPAEAIEEPASVSAPDELAPGITGGLLGPNVTSVVATASSASIPAGALAAYQRAETVINSADASCHLSWQLIAAIGRVESNHGRFGGNVLDTDGVATPGIYGLPLNGKAGTSLISDTDAGQFDRDKVFDRAVGPMQFIPSTWSVVGVDADGDGQRNPQDIDDAALASAVYLCSGSDDLATTAGQEAAVYRYNHSTSYVDLVLSIMDAYMSGDYTSVPTSVSAAGYLLPAPAPTSAPQQTKGPHTISSQGPDPVEPS